MNPIVPLLVEAERYLSQRDVDRAAELYKRASAIDGDSPLPLVGFARVALALGRIDGAISLLDFVLSKHPTSVAALTFRGLAEDARQQPAAAIPYLERAIEVSADVGTAHYNLGRCLAQLGRWKEARKSLSAATQLLPDEPAVRSAFGVACFRAGDVGEALQILGECVQRHPDHLDSLLALADALCEIGHLQLADELLANAARRFPPAGVIHSKRAALALRRKDVAGARIEAALACELLPDDEEAWLFAATVDVMDRKLQDAEHKLRHLVERSPRSWRAHYQLGVIYDAIKARRPAIAAYRNAIACNPKAWEPLNNLATILLEEGSPDSLRQARDLYRQAIAAGGDQVCRAHYNLALTLLRMGDRAGANREANKAAGLLGPHDSFAPEVQRFVAAYH